MILPVDFFLVILLLFLFLFFLFFSCFLFVSSGDSSCRFVFLVIMFFFYFFAKIHFLCSTRGHNVRQTHMGMGRILWLVFLGGTNIHLPAILTRVPGF